MNAEDVVGCLAGWTEGDEVSRYAMADIMEEYRQPTLATFFRRSHSIIPVLRYRTYDTPIWVGGLHTTTLAALKTAAHIVLGLQENHESNGERSCRLDQMYLLYRSSDYHAVIETSSFYLEFMDVPNNGINNRECRMVGTTNEVRDAID